MSTVYPPGYSDSVTSTPPISVWEAGLVKTPEQGPSSIPAQGITPSLHNFQELSSPIPQDAATSTTTPPQPQYQFQTLTAEDFIRAIATGKRPGSLCAVGPGRRTTPNPLATATPASSVPRTGTRASQADGHSQSSSAPPYRQYQSRSTFGSSGGEMGAEAGMGGMSAGTGAGTGADGSRLHASGVNRAGLDGVSPSRTCSTPIAVGTPMGISCPSSSNFHGGGGQLEVPGALHEAITSDRSSLQNVDVTTALDGQPLTLGLPKPKQYRIRTDIYFSVEENTIIAMFEIPGVKRENLQITMSVCPFTHVRQVRVHGVSVAAFPLQEHQVRERKFGRFLRTLTVPPDTKPEDISVKLEDGILTLKILGRAPAQAAQPPDVTIPIPSMD